MPNRSPKAKALIKSLPVKAPDTLCNARNPKGYCQKTSGWGTSHPGTGRCRLHGGASDGRPIMTGLYSTVLKDKLKARYESLVGDPALVSLYEELAISKVLLASVLKKFHTNLVGEETDDLTDTSWFHELFAVNKDGDEIVSAKFRAVLLVIENITKLYASISKIELQRSQILTVRDVMAIMTQIRHEMSTICGSCPCRAAVAERLAEIKVRATNEKKN